MKKANRAYHPAVYDRQLAAGRLARAQGLPRIPHDEHGECFYYGYEGTVWLEGYDEVKQPCVGCGELTTFSCPTCGRPTCQRAVQLCGSSSGQCAVCVEEALVALTTEGGVAP